MVEIRKSLLYRFLGWLLSFTFICQPVLAAPLTGNTAQSPAAQTELSQQGQSLKVDVFGPIRGLATNVADMGRDGDYAKVLNNLHMLKRGTWSTRGTGITTTGVQFPFSLVPPGPPDYAHIFSIVPAVDENGDQPIIVHARDTIYYFDHDLTNPVSMMDGSPATVDDTAQSDMRSYDGVTFVFVNGEEEVPLFWDGDPSHGFDPLHGNTRPAFNGKQYDYPKYQDSFAGRLVTSGYRNQPYSVVFSEFGDVDAYPTPTGLATDAGVVEFPAALGRITGLRSMRIDSTTASTVLLVGMEHGMGIVTGSSALDFEALELTREFGLLSHRSWLSIGNDTYFMATDGLRRISSGLGQATLAIAPLTYGISDLINRINKDEKVDIFVLHHPQTQEAIWFMSIDSEDEAAHGIVMNYNIDPSQQSAIVPNRVDNPIFSTVSGYEVQCGATIDDIAYIGTPTGTIKKLWEGDDFDGVPIEWEYVSPLIGANSPAQEASVRKFVIMTEGLEQKFGIEAYTLTTLEDNNTQWIQRFQKDVDVSKSASIPFFATWDGGTVDSYPRLIDFHTPGSGRFWCVRLVGDDTDEHIDLDGIQSILTVGGWRQ